MKSTDSVAGGAPRRGTRVRNKAWPWMVAVAVAAGAVATFQIFRPSPPTPNVLLVTIDTLRADRVGAYGFSLARTPNIDWLASDGVRCEDTIAAAPITMPSHATILTGLWPPAHGVRDNGAYALGDELVTLAERLKAAGYVTQAVVSAVVLNRRYNLSQGFDGYDDDLWSEDEPRLFMIRDRPAARTAARFVEWLDGWYAGPSRRPFFAWVHFFDPHQPYEAPARDRLLTPTPYDAEIAAADRGVGRMLDALRERGVLDDTLVILTADHGESLGEHEELTHAVFIYDATVRVPLVLRAPGVLPQGTVYTGPVRHVDVVPTVLGLLNLPGAGETQGRDLTGALRGEAAPPSLPQYSESLLSELGFGMAPLYGIRLDGFTWIRAPRPELYDVSADPGELHNLYPQAGRRAERMDQELQRLLDESGLRGAAPAKSPMSRETLEMLQSLGYVAPARERQALQGIDPKDGILVYRKLEDARHMAQAQRWPDAERLAGEIVDEIPGHVSARNVLALTLVRQGRLDEARDAYLASLSVDPGQPRVHVMLASVATALGDLDEAAQHLGEALDLEPRFVEAMTTFGLVESLRGNPEAAEAHYRRAVAADPGFPTAHRRFGDLYFDRGDFERALEAYEKTLAIAPGHFQALVQAGNTARRVGDVPRARQYFERAATVRPDSWIPSYNLACLLAVTGRPSDALVLLREVLAKGFADAALLERDEDLATVRQLPGFSAVLTEVQGRSTSGG